MPTRILPAALLFLLASAIVPAAAAERQAVRHRFAPLAGKFQPVGRLAATNRLHAAICLPLRNAVELTNLLSRIYDPTSPEYRQYLTSEAFAERFGPTQKDYDAVVAYAQSQGLAISGTHPNRLLVDVDGSTADFERAFGITLRLYQHPREKRLFHAPDAAPSLPLGVPVLAVCGLDSYAVPRPAGMRPVPAAAQATPQAGSGPSGSFMGYDFRKAYAPDVTLTGTGQSVGLLQFDGFYASDIASYISQAGLPTVPVQTVLIDGYSGSAGVNNAEVAMDIEMAISMAPGLTRVVVYEASTSAPAIDILNRMATDNTCKQLSASWTWGSLEPGTEQVFQQFAAQGQSYFNASGDSDAYTGYIDAPADDPYITVVGGTTLSTGSGGTWTSETTWNWGGGTGSGGGASTTYSIPVWQQGVDMTANHGSTTMRNVPDVSMIADNVWVLYSNGKSGAFGGTSAASPLWAGFTALINQQAVARGQSTVGFLNPAVYALGASAGYTSAFHDITTGDNTSSSSPSKYYAVSGYDLCTGWGTPAGQALINALTGPPEPLGVLPADAVTSSGPVGGPFNIPSQSYVLTNGGSASLDWTCDPVESWLTASPSGGTLASGHTVRVTVALNAAASNLAANVYSAGIHFTDAGTDAVQTRLFKLRVGQPLIENGGFETGDFSGWSPSGNTAYTAVSSSSTYVHSGSYGASFGPSGSLGYRDQSVATSAGQYYLLSFWLNSPDGKTPNEFLVQWNGTTLYDRTNLGALGWTNMIFTVYATGTTSSVRFGFRNDPTYFALDDVSLTPVSGTNPVRTLTVVSARGGASPGTTSVPSGTLVSERIVNAPVVSGTTQYVCTGGAVVGNAYTQNSTTNITLTLTNNATLTWNWQTQYRLTTAVSGTGSITPGGWYASGASVVLTATPGASAHLAGWSGNTNGCVIAGNTLTAPMTQARSITATFADGAQPVISGYVVNKSTKINQPGVTLTFSGVGTVTTDSSGNYTMTVPYNWTGTVTPSTGAGGAFSPTSKAYKSLTKSKTGQKFKWTPPPVISGTILRSGTKTAAAGITVTFSGVGSTTTDASGNYALTVPYDWTGTVTPSSTSGGTFSPVSKSFSGLTKNKSQDFTWTTAAAVPASEATPVAAATPAIAAVPMGPLDLLHTVGTVRWSAAQVPQVRLAPELLAVEVGGDTPRVTLPALATPAADLAASVVLTPAFPLLRNPAGEVLLVRNSAGTVTAEPLLPGTVVLGSVWLLPDGYDLVLSWDLTLLEP